jgi:hypothetical protein
MSAVTLTNYQAETGDAVIVGIVAIAVRIRQGKKNE